MADRANYVFPECYVDTNILKTLLNLDGVNHKHGCSQVMSGMKKGRFLNDFAIGVIDDDKKKTYDYSEFVELACSEHLRLLKHNSRHHYLIFVCKAAEDFLLSCSEELGLNLSDFGLPNTLKELKVVTKSNESDKDPRIRKLVNAVRSSKEMARLERIVRYLEDKRFGVNINDLIAVFA